MGGNFAVLGVRFDAGVIFDFARVLPCVFFFAGAGGGAVRPTTALFFFVAGEVAGFGSATVVFFLVETFLFPLIAPACFAGAFFVADFFFELTFLAGTAFFFAAGAAFLVADTVFFLARDAAVFLAAGATFFLAVDAAFCFAVEVVFCFAIDNFARAGFFLADGFLAVVFLVLDFTRSHYPRSSAL